MLVGMWSGRSTIVQVTGLDSTDSLIDRCSDVPMPAVAALQMEVRPENRRAVTPGWRSALLCLVEVTLKV
jgi:hypothetical protein